MSFYDMVVSHFSFNNWTLVLIPRIVFFFVVVVFFTFEMSWSLRLLAMDTKENKEQQSRLQKCFWFIDQGSVITGNRDCRLSDFLNSDLQR